MAKYLLNALTTVLARALAGTPILVNAVDPGNTATHPSAVTTRPTVRSPKAPATSSAPPPSMPTDLPDACSATHSPELGSVRP
jgi:NAD(P)-dependent dehydrogenase (short-subunit alcohol dehydrogenase family)